MRWERIIPKTGKVNFNIKRRIISAEGEMSEVGIPPHHNLDNPNALVDSINNNKYLKGKFSRNGIVFLK